MLMLIESGILYVLFFVSYVYSLPPHTLLKIYLQAGQVAICISPVNGGAEKNAGLAFALNIALPISNLIVVYSLSNDFP